MTRRRAVVIGLGRSGLAVARVLSAEGMAVRVVDQRETPALRAAAARLPADVEVVLGGYDESVVDDADLVSPSPGVRWDAAVLERARRLGIPVRSEIDLVFERCPAPIVGITGTNGKTTTTALTGQLLSTSGLRVHVGGNIGETMLDRLQDVGRDDWVVLELSSFQLESAHRPRCRVAAVLNLGPDHLDRHGDMEHYVAAKRRIVDHADPQGTVVLNAADPLTRAMATGSPAPVSWFAFDAAEQRPVVTVRDGMVVALDAENPTPVLPVDDIPLFGRHNVENVLAAVAMARAVGVPAEPIAAGIRAFRPVPHRLEPVCEVNAVLWVNDSKATNVDSAIVALRSFPGRSIVWIGGGGRKGVPCDRLATEVASRVRFAVLNGESAAELDEALAQLGFASRVVVPSLREAVEAAARVARPGDVVLLAPGYTSFDQFGDYEERGRVFARWVRALVGATPGDADDRSSTAATTTSSGGTR